MYKKIIMSTLLGFSAAAALASPPPQTHPDHPYPGIGRVVELDFGENAYELRFERDGRTMTYVGIRGPEEGETETVEYTAIATAPVLTGPGIVDAANVGFHGALLTGMG